MRTERSVPRFLVMAGLILFAVFVSCGRKEINAPEAKVEPGGAKKESAERLEVIPETVTLTPNAIQEAAIRTWPISPVAPSGSLTLNGLVGYDENHLLVVAPPVSGRVVQLPVDLGQAVSKGQPVAWIESLELGRTRQEYVRALTELDVAQKNYDRARLLVAAKAISDGEFQQREGDYLVKRASVSAAEAALRQAGDNPADARNRQTAGTVPRVALRAPFNGRVVDRKVTPGSLVEALHPIVTIADLSSVWCFFQAYDNDLAVIRTGLPIAVASDAFPDGHFSGTIDFIGSEVDAATRTVRVRATVRNGEQKLRPGLFVKGRVTVPRLSRKGVLAVPKASLQTLEGRSTIFVRLDATRFTRRFVEIGQPFDGYVEVLHGVRLGEQVVVDGSFVLKSEFSKASLAEAN